MSGLYRVGIVLLSSQLLCAAGELPMKPRFEPEILEEIPLRIPTELTETELPSIDSCPAIADIDAEATVEVLRQAVQALNAASNFTMPEFDQKNLTADSVERKLFDAFGHDNYIQLLNPEHEAIYRSLKQLVKVNPELDAPCILRFYLARRGELAAAAPATTPSGTPPTTGTPPVTTPPRTPILPTPTTPGGTPATPARPSAPLDLKPLNDASSKMNSALSRLRNAKGVKITAEQRKELKKEADKLFKENNPRLKEATQRFERVLNQPGLSSTPDKLAPFKRFVDTYRALEREVAKI